MMQRRILLLWILGTSVSSFCLGQTPETFHIEGTWSNTTEIDGIGKYGQAFVVSSDTLLIKSTDSRGVFSKLQLVKYTIVKDTLIGNEIEYISFNSNLGFIEEHDKNRRLLVKIPLCRFRNECTEGVIAGLQRFRKESNERTIIWDFKDWLASDAVKWPRHQLIKDY